MATRALRAEIAVPLGESWDELGMLLRVQRKILPQLLRAGMDARIACGVVGTEDAKKKVSPDARGKSSGTVVYQAIKVELVKVQNGKWKPEARPCLELCGGMLSALAQQVSQRYSKRPSYGGSQPIPVRKQETKISLEDKSVVLDVLLISTRRTRVVLQATKGSHWHTLRGIAKGVVKHGDVRIVYDETKKKWYAIIAYEKQEAAPLTVDPARALIVHRGVNQALTFLTTTGHYSWVSGRKLLTQLTALEARTRDHRMISRAELGSGAKGHGVKRRFERHEVLAGKRANVIKTWCQQMAAEVARVARARGCALIIIEDYGGIQPPEEAVLRRVLVRFPLYQLKQAIVNRLAVDGMTLREVPAEYVNSTCPRCENADASQCRGETFHCLKCGYERSGDMVAALNMLYRADVDTSVWDERFQFEGEIASIATGEKKDGYRRSKKVG